MFKVKPEEKHKFMAALWLYTAHSDANTRGDTCGSTGVYQAQPGWFCARACANVNCYSLFTALTPAACAVNTEHEARSSTRST